MYFRKWNFLALILRGFLYFPKRKLFWYFAKWNFLYFRKRKPEKAPYISGKGTLLHFRKRKSRKNALYFRKPNFLIFPENGNFLIFFRERDIQNPGIFRIFILEYLTLPLPASTLNFFPKECYSKNLSFNLGNRVFYIFPKVELSSLIFQELTF